jgi:carboxyl-terminal processing protease
LLLDKLGFIAIEGFECGNPEQKSEYATTLQQLIRDLDEQEPCGWMVDLHENTGGNKWPMLAGLGPIVGEREVGACIDPDGHKEIWSYRDGQAPAGEYIRTQVNGPAYELKATSPPVAVLPAS